MTFYNLERDVRSEHVELRKRLPDIFVENIDNLNSSCKEVKNKELR